MFKRFFSVILLILTIGTLGLFGCTSVVEAASIERVFAISKFPKMDINIRYFKDVRFPLEGEELKFKVTSYNDSGRFDGNIAGYVGLVNATNEMVYYSFPIRSNVNFYAKRVVFDSGKECLLVCSGGCFVSELSCDNFWLLGKQDGKWITYATMDNAVNAGLLHSNIQAFLSGDGKLWIQGTTRDRNCRNYSNPADNSLRYKGHPAYMDGLADCSINAVAYFWDSYANWFGMEYHDVPMLSNRNFGE